MNTDKATPELFAAIAAAQTELENAAKNSANPHFRSKYADLAEILNTVRPTYAAHGVAIIQGTAFDPETTLVTVTTCLAHSSGGFVTTAASCVPAKTDAQGIGAATTYLRRYGLAALAGISQEDDDGNSAMHGKTAATISSKQATKIRMDLIEAGGDLAQFERFVGCKIEDITIANLPRIERAIAAKAAKASSPTQGGE